MRPLGKRTSFYLTAALVCMLALALPVPRPVSASIIPSTITVSKTTLENDDQNGCSLYEALQATFNGAPYHQCNAGPDANIIIFSGAAAGGTITMPSKPNDIDLPMINRNVTITGPIIFNGNGANTDQHIFRIAPGGTLNLLNLVIKNAHTSGGGAAILDLNQGTLNVLGVSFEGNVAEGDGGAINSNGTVNILSSNFVANKALGIMPDKSNNPGTGYGGAINMSGSDKLKLALSNFSGNLADKGGGALYHSSQSAEVSDVIFSGNIVNGTGANDKAPKGGGAIYNDANSELTVIRNAFNGNLTPTSDGGAFYNAIDATAVISDSSFNGNIAGAPSGGGNGGAIYNPGGDLSVTRVTFLTNAAIGGDGGAIANDRRGDALIANSSFTANAAANGNGGAINNTTTQQGGPISSVLAKNVTFSANVALNSSNHGGAIFNAQGHSFTLGNTIVDKGPVDISYTGDNCTGTITTLGHNLDSGNTCGFDTNKGDLISADPQLDAPAFNGGPLVSLLTQKLETGSAAIDKGDPNICAAQPVGNVDQRGKTRPKDGDGAGGAVCDIGSFESDTLQAGYGSTPVQPGPIAFGNAFANGSDTVDTTISIFETGNATLIVSNPQIAGANSGDFTVKAPSPFPLNIQDGGAERTVALTCKPGAVGQRTATLTLTTNDPTHSSVTYNLTCNGTTQPTASYASDPLAPGPIDFGSVTINTIAPASLAINNTGDASLHVDKAAAALGGANPGDFKIVTAFPLDIGPGISSTVALQCKPLNLGIRTATLTLTTNDPNRPTVVYNLACTGEPVPPPILEAPGESLPYPLPASPLHGPYGVATSPDGRNVYAADYGNDRLIVFTRDTISGNITWKESKINGSGGVVGMDGPYLATVSPDGANVYVTGSNSDSVVTFKRNSNDGTLTFVSKVSKGDPYGPFALNALDGAYAVVVSSDGRYAYVSSIYDNTVVVLNRSSTTGALSIGALSGPVQTYKSASLSYAYGIALSSDGTSLYLTGYLSDSLEVLKRNVADGKLTFVERYINGQQGVDGLNGVFRATISPDGAHVYTASYDDSAVTAFSRDQSTGKLTYITKYKDGVGGVDGLASGTSVAISPDGSHLFATGFNDNAVAVFDRDTTTGLLTQAQVIKRNTNTGLPGLGGARDLAISPDGRTVYATGFNDNKVMALHPANPVPTLISFNPASAMAGGAAFTLTVNGASFMPASQVRWNGANRPTSFVNNTQLTTKITAADITAAGSADVTVVNPAPGGGVSNVLKFTITALGQNPVPSITTLTPASAAAGAAVFTLTVNGSNFMASSKLRWNGADRTTSFVNSAQLTAHISAADIAAPGPVGITVINLGPGGGASNAATFDVAAPGENPTPSIASISPNQVMTDIASATAITLIVNGINFMADSQAQWNGANRPTSFVNTTQLKMTITPADLALGGKGSITVVNPEPGGGTSNTATFTIITIRSRAYLPLIKR